jgi:hypothetical protein
LIPHVIFSPAVTTPTIQDEKSRLATAVQGGND